MPPPSPQRRFLHQAARRGILSVTEKQRLAQVAEALAESGQPVDLLELVLQGASPERARRLRRLHDELNQESRTAPTDLIEAPAAEETRTPTQRLDGPPPFTQPPPASVATTIALSGAPVFNAPPIPLAPQPVAVERTPEPPGTRVGNYEIVDCLGQGANGSVYRARHAFVQNEVAMKLLHEGATPQQIKRFYREARAATLLRHPGLISVLDLGLHEDRPYLVMELVEGETLAKLIRREGRLPPRRSARYAEQIALGLALAHQTLLHRDIKPENILVSGDRARLTDFGLVRQVRRTERLTSVGDLLGSPAYMAPEQARGEVELDARVDIYGLGAALFEMLTGLAPFDGDTLTALLLAVIEEEPPRPSRIAPEVDAAIEGICLRCLAKDREQRYPSAQALAEDLARYRQGRLGRGRETRR